MPDGYRYGRGRKERQVDDGGMGEGLRAGTCAETTAAVEVEGWWLVVVGVSPVDVAMEMVEFGLGVVNIRLKPYSYPPNYTFYTHTSQPVPIRYRAGI